MLALALSASLWHAPPSSAQDDQAGYSDVKADNEYYDDVTALLEAGVLADDECGDGQFCPDNDLDRRSLVTWLIRSMEADDSLDWLEKRNWTHLKLQLNFDDEGELSKDEVAKQLSMWALGLDCLGSTMDGCLARPVSRQQMAPFVVLAFGVPEAKSAGFIDLGQKNPYEPAIDRLADAGIVKSCTIAAPRYCPDDILSRGEMASLLAEAEHWRNPPTATTPEPETDEDEDDGNDETEADETEKETVEEDDDGGDEISTQPAEEDDEDDEVVAPVTTPPAEEEEDDEPEETVALPGAPTNVSLSLAGSDGIAVTWQAPGGGGQVEHYQLAWRIKEDTAWTSGSSLPPQTRSDTIAGLQMGQTYEVRVEAANETGSTVSEAEEISIPLPAPEEPRDVRIDSLSDNRFVVHWKEPSGGGTVAQYSVQWRGRHQGFSDSRRSLLEPSELTTVGTAPERMFSLTLNKPDVYMVRVSAVNSGGTTPAGETLVPTKSNKIVRHIERDLVGEYGDEYPWLVETWEYIKDPSFEITTGGYREAWVEIHWLGGYPLDRTRAEKLVIYPGWIGRSYLDIYAHELAHVYTLTNDLAEEPAPLAFAHLYFSRLANGSGSSNCWAEELYADTAAVMIFPSGRDYYWTSACPGQTRPTAEAIEVVRQAFNGQVPDWFYETYEDSSGAVDLEAVWSDVKAMEDDWFSLTVAYQLRNAFGGYCDAYQAGRSADGRDVTVRNPWRDGGCVPKAPRGVSLTPGNRSIALSWQEPAYDGGQDLIGYVVEWKASGQSYSSFRRMDVSAGTRSTVINNLRNGVEYTVRVTAVNGLDDGNYLTWDDGLGTPSPGVSAIPRAG
ncbi:fibronectin type III domain-containing protein [Candidatus Saccharibacteria bacterium]|nr:fibronectin type III domain-containing protein [Candidatus Saccharibacteria bacterium]